MYIIIMTHRIFFSLSLRSEHWCCNYRFNEREKGKRKRKKDVCVGGEGEGGGGVERKRASFTMYKQ